MFLNKRQRSLPHTIQEIEGAATATKAAIKHFNAKAKPNQLLTVMVGVDNTAAQKNLSKPGNNPSMVAALEVLARTRNMTVSGLYVNKDYMDNQSNIDELGRRVAGRHPEDWGLKPKLVRRILNLLQHPFHPLKG